MLVTEHADAQIRKLKEEMDRLKAGKKLKDEQYWVILKKIGEVEEELAAI